MRTARGARFVHGADFVVALVVALAVALAAAAPSAMAGEAATDLDWITGHWRRELVSMPPDSPAGRPVAARNETSEEIWTNGEGGVYFGVNRLIKGGETTRFEFLRIEMNGGAPVFVAQPGGAPPVRFAVIETSDKRIVFSNPQHDDPKFIEYARNGDTLTARVWGDEGREKANIFSWAQLSD